MIGGGIVRTMSANNLIIFSIIFIAVAVAFDMAVNHSQQEYVNSYICYSVIIVLFLPVMGVLVGFYGWVWRGVRIVTVLLAVPTGLSVAPPIMDTPPWAEWSVSIGIFQYIILIASFAVAFLLIRVGAADSASRD